MALPIPNFIDRNPAAILAEIKADYEARTGRTVEPAQVEMLVFQAQAYRELLVRNQIQDASLQNLVAYARYPMLDYLGELVGVTRLPAASAFATILLTLVEGHGDVVIPSGTRIQSTDGRATFTIIQNYSVLAADNTVTVSAIATTPGTGSNDYAIGAVSVILDPYPYLATASNIDITEGGSNAETDDQLRERIRLAPNAFSTAGPYKAYEYWTKTASPLIIDVAVDNRRYQDGDTIPAGKSIGDPIPGTVEVFPLVEDLDETPPELLEAILVILNADRIRPLNDTVFATSPTGVDTSIVVELILYSGAVVDNVVPVVEANLEAFRDGRRKLLGQDVIIDQIKALSVVEGVYKANVITPATDLIVGYNQFANITAINVTVVGYNEG